jgi:GTP cyclohydrolase III
MESGCALHEDTLLALADVVELALKVGVGAGAVALDRRRLSHFWSPM